MEWKDIKGYEGLYQINKEGQVKRDGRYIEPGNCNTNPRVKLYKHGEQKQFTIYKLLEETFKNDIIITHEEDNEMGLETKLNSNKRVLVIGDIHLPFEHSGYLALCEEVKEKWGCDTVIQVGDIIDNHAVSRHATEVDAMGGYSEYTMAKEKLKSWFKAFPNMKICAGNHDNIPMRQAKSLGLHKGFIKTFQEQWGTPEGWEIAPSYIIDDVYYTHGVSSGGANGTLNYALKNGMSTVVGHKHSVAGVRYHTNANGKTIFAVDTGCGIDSKEYAFRYGSEMPNKPILSCVVVDGNNAYVITMDER